MAHTQWQTRSTMAAMWTRSSMWLLLQISGCGRCDVWSGVVGGGTSWSVTRTNKVQNIAGCWKGLCVSHIASWCAKTGGMYILGSRCDHSQSSINDFRTHGRPSCSHGPYPALPQFVQRTRTLLMQIIRFREQFVRLMIKRRRFSPHL